MSNLTITVSTSTRVGLSSYFPSVIAYLRSTRTDMDKENTNMDPAKAQIYVV